MDLLGIQADLAKTEQALNAALDRIAALETQMAKDINSIADKVISALLPEVQASRAALIAGIEKITASADTLTLTVNASVTEALALARRIDGATFKLGPEETLA